MLIKDSAEIMFGKQEECRPENQWTKTGVLGSRTDKEENEPIGCITFWG